MSASNEPLIFIVEFLNRIGIQTVKGRVPPSSFLPGVRIDAGCLIYEASMPWPGDLLHEAGHVATAPACLRSSLADGVELPDWVPYATEAEATAWAYAATQHLDLHPSVLFHPGGYHGASEQLIVTFSAGVYPGAYGLAQSGMTRIGTEARSRGEPTYPRMVQWLRA